MLGSIPEPTDPADTPIVENFVKAKLRLASELYGQKKIPGSWQAFRADRRER